MQKFLPAFLFLLLSASANTQPGFEFATLQSRQRHDKNLVENVIGKNLRLPLSTATEEAWRSAFWAMELMLYRNDFAKQKLSQAWRLNGNQSVGFQKALLEATYTLYPATFDKEVLSLLRTTPSPAIFVRCAEYLLLSTNKATYKTLLARLLQTKRKENKFTGYDLLQKRLNQNWQALPPLDDLFRADFLPGQTVIYSLHRRSRAYAGLVLVRQPNGHFVKNANGRFFHTAQLARAITGYPYYITNGNTPQGLFRWTGFDTSSIAYIGPTTNLQLVMPFEATPSLFFGDSTFGNMPWDKVMYTTLLPQSWKAYNGIYESFYAGEIGRSEIIMHGTTINPVYYKGQPYHPQTPSLGCLCSYEEWDSQGKRTVSNQQQVVDALLRTGTTNGYVVVIDLNDKAESVSINEVLRFLK